MGACALDHRESLEVNQIKLGNLSRSPGPLMLDPMAGKLLVGKLLSFGRRVVLPICCSDLYALGLAFHRPLTRVRPD